MTEKMAVQNVGQPGKTYRVDAEKFMAMRAAVLAVCPAAPPGLTPAEIIAGRSVPRWRKGGLVGEKRAAGSGSQRHPETRAKGPRAPLEGVSRATVGQ
jgi:hypothetical protein